MSATRLIWRGCSARRELLTIRIIDVFLCLYADSAHYHHYVHAGVGAGAIHAGKFCCALVLMSLMLIQISIAVAETAGQRVPVFRIEVGDKSPAEVGAELGRKVKEQFSDIEASYDSYLAGTFNQAQFDTWLSERVKSLHSTAIDTAYREQVQGLAGALDLIGRNRLGDGHLSLDELWFLQFIPDIGGHTGGWGYGVYGKRTARNGTLIGRNLDRIGNSALRSLQAISVFVNDGRTVVNIGFAGVLSLVTGFNDRGLFLAYLDATPTLGQLQSEPSVATSAIGFELLRALETQNGITGATRTLSRNQYSVDHSVLLAGPKSVKVLEHPVGQPASLRKASTSTRPVMAWGRSEQIAVVGCFALPKAPANCQDLRDRYRWQRLRELANFTPKGTYAGVSELAYTSLDSSNGSYALFGPTTLQSMVFDVEQRVLQLYAAPSDGSQPSDPVMQLYSDLISESRDSHSGISASMVVYWILVLSLGVILAYIRWRYRRGSK